jgi:hypothetical protein
MLPVGVGGDGRAAAKFSIIIMVDGFSIRVDGGFNVVERI